MAYSLRLTHLALASLGFGLSITGCGGSSRSPGGNGADAAGSRSPTNEKSLFLVGPLDTEATQCVAKAEPNAALLARGMLDLGLASTYAASLLVGYQSTLANPSAGTSAERVALETAEVSLNAADGTPLLSFTTAVTGSVDSGSPDSAGYVAVQVTLVTPALALPEPVKSAQDLVANVRVSGSTSDGKALTTNSVAIPITVCTGCLLQYPASAADVSARGSYKCVSLSSLLSEPPPSAPCVLGQDVPFSCVLCADTQAICRDPMLNPELFLSRLAMNPLLIVARRLTGFIGIGLLIASCGGKSHTDSNTNEPAPSAGPDQALFLIGVVDSNTTGCLTQVDKGAQLLASGTLDVAFSTAYSAVVQVGNELAQLGSTQATGATERVSLRSAEVSLQMADGTVVGSYSTVGTGFIDAAPAGATAYGAMAITVIPAALGATDPVKTATDLYAKIRVTGEALDGTALTSTVLDFPIHVCNGCLVQYPSSALDVTVGAGNDYRCTTADANTQVPRPCILGQDQPFSCQLCSAMFDVCRDPTSNPSHPPAGG